MYYGILVQDPFLLCPLPVYLWSKLIGADNQESPVIARKHLLLYHSNTKLGCVLTNAIRVYKDRPIAGVTGA